MSTDDLKKALIGIVLSQMENYSNTIMNVATGSKLHRDVNWDMHNMWDIWWKPHFPHFDYAFRIQTTSIIEPTVFFRWTSDHVRNYKWEEMVFKFSPVRLESDNNFDHVAAYDRAMGIL